MTNAPVPGCTGCASTGGRLCCPYHSFEQVPPVIAPNDRIEALTRRVEELERITAGLHIMGPRPVTFTPEVSIVPDELAEQLRSAAARTLTSGPEPKAGHCGFFPHPHHPDMCEAIGCGLPLSDHSEGAQRYYAALRSQEGR